MFSFLAPFASKTLIYLLAVVAVVAIVSGVFFSIRHLENQKATLQVQLAETRQTLEQAQAAIAEQQRAMAAYGKVQQGAANNVRRLNHVLQRHNLSKLGKAHPEMVGRALNDGTARYQRLLECATGGPCPADPTAPASGAGSP